MARRRATGERSEKWSVFGSALALLTIKEVLPGVRDDQSTAGAAGNLPPRPPPPPSPLLAAKQKARCGSGGVGDGVMGRGKVCVCGE